MATYANMAVGVWYSISENLPAFKINDQTFEITDWGSNVHSATILVHDFEDAEACLGYNLQRPLELQPAAIMQVVSLTRWDTSGNKISDGTFTLQVDLPRNSSSNPVFKRYNDGSAEPSDLILEGGTVEKCGSACYIVTAVKTSSFAAFNSVSSSSPSPSPSPSSGPSSTGGDDGLLPWLGLLALVAVPLLVFAVWRFWSAVWRGRPEESLEEEQDVPISEEEQGEGDHGYPFMFTPVPSFNTPNPVHYEEMDTMSDCILHPETCAMFDAVPPEAYAVSDILHPEMHAISEVLHPEAFAMPNVLQPEIYATSNVLHPDTHAMSNVWHPEMDAMYDALHPEALHPETSAMSGIFVPDAFHV